MDDFKCVGCGVPLQAIDVWYGGMYCSDECQDGHTEAANDQ